MNTSSKFSTNLIDNWAYAVVLVAAAFSLIALLATAIDSSTAPIEKLDTIVVTASRMPTVQLDAMVVTAPRAPAVLLVAAR